MPLNNRALCERIASWKLSNAYRGLAWGSLHLPRPSASTCRLSFTARIRSQNQDHSPLSCSLDRNRSSTRCVYCCNKRKIKLIYNHVLRPFPFVSSPCNIYLQTYSFSFPFALCLFFPFALRLSFPFALRLSFPSAG